MSYNASDSGSASDKATAELPIKLPLILKAASEYSASEDSKTLSGLGVTLL